VFQVYFQKSDACAETHPGEPDTETVGPFEYVQVTYELLRSGPEDSDLAKFDSECCWLTVSGNHYSDFVVAPA
jgi:hypothetical protein